MFGLIELALLTDASLLHSLMYKQQHDQDLPSTHKRERLCGPAPASQIRSTHHSADSKGVQTGASGKRMNLKPFLEWQLYLREG